jgi:hypothetical protein
MRPACQVPTSRLLKGAELITSVVPTTANGTASNSPEEFREGNP